MRHIRRARPNGSCVRGGNGNLANDGTLQLSYDAFNRLILVKRKSDGATIGQYVYDALNRRTRKTISNGGLSGDIPNGTTDYLYQDWQIVEERSGSTVNKQYVWGSYIDECIQLRTYVTSGAGSLPAGDYYPLQDLLYRTTALTDDEGDIVEAYDYDAYGNTLIFSAAGPDGNWWADDATQANYAACEVLYCGYRFDPEAQTYQVRNREYYPMLGRWLQRDPIGFDGGDWNLYGYVKNNPIVKIDTFGLLKIKIGSSDHPLLEFDTKDIHAPGSVGRGLLTGDRYASDEALSAAIVGAGDWLYKCEPVRGAYISWSPPSLPKNSPITGGIGITGAWTVDSGLAASASATVNVGVNSNAGVTSKGVVGGYSEGGGWNAGITGSRNIGNTRLGGTVNDPLNSGNVTLRAGIVDPKTGIQIGLLIDPSKFNTWFVSGSCDCDE